MCQFRVTVFLQIDSSFPFCRRPFLFGHLYTPRLCVYRLAILPFGSYTVLFYQSKSPSITDCPLQSIFLFGFSFIVDIQDNKRVSLWHDVEPAINRLIFIEKYELIYSGVGST